jgi:hypothetical protein
MLKPSAPRVSYLKLEAQPPDATPVVTDGVSALFSACREHNACAAVQHYLAEHASDMPPGDQGLCG